MEFLLMDPARELHSQELYDCLKVFDIEPLAIAAEAQWTNPAENKIKILA